jgi:eukaryotic-like serine/threonine-protein kinase
MSLHLGARLGAYEILSLLGSGGMGEVYLAQDTKLRRRVALKVLPDSMACDPDRRQRFEREAQAIAALNHPNIVTIHSVDESADVLSLIMELVEGRSLSDCLPPHEFDLTANSLSALAALAPRPSALDSRGIAARDFPGDPTPARGWVSRAESFDQKKGCRVWVRMPHW